MNPTDKIQHGTLTGYYHFRCTCDQCTSAGLAYKKAQREERKEKKQCPDCGSKLSAGDLSEGYVYCDACRNSRKAATERWRDRKDKQLISTRRLNDPR